MIPSCGPRRRNLIAIGVAWCLCGESVVGAEADWRLRILSVSGEVTLQRREKAAPSPAKAEQILSPADRVRTGKDGRAELVAPEGSLIELQPMSSLVLEALEPMESRFELAWGLLLARVRFAPERRWELRSRQATVAVRGTEFAISESTDATRVGVFDEGIVEVRSTVGEAQTLEARQETTVEPGKAPAPPQALDYFRFAAKRMALLRKRQKFFMDVLRKKYKMPGPR